MQHVMNRLAEASLKPASVAMHGCLCVYGPVVEDAEIMPIEPGIGSPD